MGLFDSVKNALSGDDAGDESAGGNDDGTGEQDGMVNVEGRANIVETHYDDVTGDQARRIAEILADHLEERSVRVRDIVEDVEELGLSHDRADTIVRTEFASIQLMDSVRTYREQPRSDEFEFYLPGELDDRAHPVRRKTVEEIEARGGAVPLDELQEILRENAEKYRDEGGTPERVDHWVGHEMPRYSIVRHVEG